MLNVLVVDDHPADRKAARTILVRQGFQVTVCSTAEAPSHLAEGKRFDLVLLPTEGKDLKDHAGLVGTPLIVTGSGAEIGSEFHLAKPFHQETFLEVVFAAAKSRDPLS